MKLSIDQLISIVSAVGISTIIGTIFTFVQFNKKNNLEYITQERAKWRKTLRKILVDIEDTSKRSDAITRLKYQLNPYGRNMDIKNTKPYFMKEGHIWDLLEKDISELDKEKLSFYIELLLKYDWERSKQEIKFKSSTLFRWIIWLTLFGLSICSCFIIFSKGLKNCLDLFIFILLIVSVIFVLFQPMRTNYIKLVPSRHKREQLWTFLILYAFPYASTSLTLLLNIPFLKSVIFAVFILVGLFVYEFYYLSLIESIEDDYIREVERVNIKRSYHSKKAIKIYNSINKIERILYGQYIYNETAVESLRKKRRKLQKKLIKKSRPRNFLIHPCLYIKYF